MKWLSRKRVSKVSSPTVSVPKPSVPPTVFSTINGVAALQIQVFDPSLKHFESAYRFGGLADNFSPETAKIWRTMQDLCTIKVIRSLVQSPVGESLVLRGSWLMREWFESSARAPHDVDFVCTASVTADELVRIVDPWLRNELASDPTLLADGLQTTTLWAYEVVQGRRFVVPWSAGDVNGVVQVDVTVDEEIFEPPQKSDLPSAGISVMAATKSQALAWKIFWLMTDAHPQGKDLYDAVLLAREVSLSPELERWLRNELEPEMGRPWDGTLMPTTTFRAEWKHFESEYPNLARATSEPLLRDELVALLNN
jgi:Nucleotidyl transferase AbiEii toxin, Type IV TA system